MMNREAAPTYDRLATWLVRLGLLAVVALTAYIMVTTS
jgi:hypothetical protein